MWFTGISGIERSVASVKLSQLAFLKLHHLRSTPVIMCSWRPIWMTEGRCWLWGKSSRTRHDVGRERPADDDTGLANIHVAILQSRTFPVAWYRVLTGGRLWMPSPSRILHLGQYLGIPSLGGAYWNRRPRLQGVEGLVTDECGSSAPMAACNVSDVISANAGDIPVWGRWHMYGVWDIATDICRSTMFGMEWVIDNVEAGSLKTVSVNHMVNPPIKGKSRRSLNLLGLLSLILRCQQRICSSHWMWRLMMAAHQIQTTLILLPDKYDYMSYYSGTYVACSPVGKN